MTKKRPINLDLTTLHYPPMAIVSILHRISGVLLFVLLPAVFYFLYSSLKSEASFLYLQQNITIKFFWWVFLSALSFHFVAGIRHFIMDVGYAEEVTVARKTAQSILIAAFIFIILLGVWIW